LTVAIDAYNLRFYAMSADVEAAKILNIDPGSTLLAIERTSWIGTAPITEVKAHAEPGYEFLASN